MQRETRYVRSIGTEMHSASGSRPFRRYSIEITDQMNFRPLLLLATVIALEACQTVPTTRRPQLNLVGESTLMGMASTQYADFLSQTPPLPPSDARVKEVRDIGQRLASAAGEYLRANNAGDRVKDFAWEFNVV